MLNLLRPPLPEEGKPPPALPAAEDWALMLDRIVGEEAEARALIAGASARRTEMLMREGSDAAIRRLEQAVDSAHLQIERLAMLRPELEARIAAQKDETRTAAWITMRSRLIEHLWACAEARRKADALYAGLMKLKLEALNAGYRMETDVVPLSIFALAGADHCEDMARSLTKRDAFTPPPPTPLWNVRFLGWTQVSLGMGRDRFPTAYMAGQEAGFPAAEARHLVDAGLAELADPKPLPPAPPKKPRPRHTRAEQQRLADVQDGGRRPVRQRDTPEPLPPEHPTRTWTPVGNGGL